MELMYGFQWQTMEEQQQTPLHILLEEFSLISNLQQFKLDLLLQLQMELLLDGISPVKQLDILYSVLTT